MVNGAYKGSRGKKRALPVLVDEEIFIEKNKRGNLVYVTKEVKPDQAKKTTTASQSKLREQTRQSGTPSFSLARQQHEGKGRGDGTDKRKHKSSKVCHSLDI
jgi:hypothetical protein